MPEQLWFTAILNRLFAGPVTSLLLALHIKPKYPAAPIPNSFAIFVPDSYVFSKRLADVTTRR